MRKTAPRSCFAISRIGVACGLFILLAAAAPTASAQAPRRPGTSAGYRADANAIAGSNGPVSVMEFTDLEEMPVEQVQVRTNTPAPLPPVDPNTAAMPAPGMSGPTPRTIPNDAANRYPNEPAVVNPNIIGEYPPPKPEVAWYVEDPEVLATEMPSPADGLDGNRQISLTPFPNMNLQAGPLSVEQLPWYNKGYRESPFSLLKSTEFQSQIGFLQDNTDLPTKQPFGWYNSIQSGFPLWKERKIGAQMGFVGEATTYPQALVMFTAGLYHRAIWEEDQFLPPFRRISFGSVYDGLYDSENREFIGQIRSQISFANTRSSEAGVWFDIPVNTDFVPQDAEGIPAQFQTSRAWAFYYRHVFPNEFDCTAFIGTTNSPGGGIFGTYMSYRFTHQAAWIFSTLLNTDRLGPFSVYTGLCFYPYPVGNYNKISGNPDNLYRPYLRVADHINLQVRKLAPAP